MTNLEVEASDGRVNHDTSRASFDVTQRVKTFQERGFRFEAFPTGWFQVGWSEEFPVGEAKALSYFGEEQVAFRGESGKLNIFDAFCPHLGGHLGHGGIVRGESIVCPFHGWRFDSSGANVEIPYSSDCSRRSLTPWEVRENSGAVFVWHHPDRSAPSWELPNPVVDEWAESSFHQPFPHSRSVPRDIRASTVGGRERHRRPSLGIRPSYAAGDWMEDAGVRPSSPALSRHRHRRGVRYTAGIDGHKRAK